MNTIEERLWSYIDGTCTDDERRAIDVLIANDEAYRSKFEELLSFDKHLAKMEADEPSMGFTFKVMETIRAEHALTPLKSGINPRIIKGISWFFIVTIVLSLILAMSMFRFSPVNFSVQLPESLKLPESLNLPDMKSLGGPLLKGFFYFDIVLALFLMDGWLRRKKLSKQV
jgi:hypothetical protein